MRAATVLALMLSSITPAFAQADADPTFNGLAHLVTCFVRAIVACNGEYCQQPVPPYIGDWGGTLMINLAEKSYSFSSSSTPLNITKQSTAELNKPLWLQFQVTDKDTPLNMMLTLQPTPAGSYVISAVGSTKFNDNGKQLFALETFECRKIK